MKDNQGKRYERYLKENWVKVLLRESDQETHLVCIARKAHKIIILCRENYAHIVNFHI